jgi:hypothetical protein
MRVGRWAVFLVIAGCGTNASTPEHRDPPQRGAVFVCASDIFGSDRCYATKVEDVPKWDIKDPKLADRAWCIATPARADSNGRLCYVTLDDCTRRAHMDPLSEGPCKQEDAAVASLEVYGEGQPAAAANARERERD